MKPAAASGAHRAGARERHDARIGRLIGSRPRRADGSRTPTQLFLQVTPRLLARRQKTEGRYAQRDSILGTCRTSIVAPQHGVAARADRPLRCAPAPVART